MDIWQKDGQLSEQSLKVKANIKKTRQARKDILVADQPLHWQEPHDPRFKTAQLNATRNALKIGLL